MFYSEAIVNKLHNQRKTFLTVLIVFTVFLGCFEFPIINLTREHSYGTNLVTAYVLVIGHDVIGSLSAGLFPKKNIVTIFLLLCGLTCVGMGCRYLLEFGEVSNIYNFTGQNIAFHLFVTTAYTSLIWLLTSKKVRMYLHE